MGNYVNRGWSESPANDFESLLNPLCYPWRNTARFNEADVHVIERSPEDLQRIKEVKKWVRGPDYDKKWTLIYPFDGIAVPFPPVPVPFGEDDWQFKALKGLTLASFVYMVLAKRQGWHKLKYTGAPSRTKEMMINQMKRQTRIAKDARSVVKDRFY